MDVVVARHWMHLGLATQATKCSGENNPVVILVKRAAAQFFRAVQGFAKSFAVEQGLPIQGVHSIGKVRLASGFGGQAARGLQPCGVHVDQQQALVIVEKLACGQAVLVAGGIAVGIGQDQPTFMPAFGQQVVEVRPP